jgi:CopG family transcriptional regulator/antitoxin EndoAI
MKATKSITIYLPPELLKKAEEVAKEESRNKSELVREALRQYIEKREWEKLQKYGMARSKEAGFTEEDVEQLVHEYRRQKRQRAKGSS